MTAGSASRLRDLNRQIDQGAERVLSAPRSSSATLYAKLDKLRVERDRLQAQLDATGQAETGSNALDDEKVEEAARVLRDMRERLPGCRAGGGSGVACPVGLQG